MAFLLCYNLFMLINLPMVALCLSVVAILGFLFAFIYSKAINPIKEKHIIIYRIYVGFLYLFTFLSLFFIIYIFKIVLEDGRSEPGVISCFQQLLTNSAPASIGFCSEGEKYASPLIILSVTALFVTVLSCYKLMKANKTRKNFYRTLTLLAFIVSLLTAYIADVVYMNFYESCSSIYGGDTCNMMSIDAKYYLIMGMVSLVVSLTVVTYFVFRYSSSNKYSAKILGLFIAIIVLTTAFSGLTFYRYEMLSHPQFRWSFPSGDDVAN